MEGLPESRSYPFKWIGLQIESLIRIVLAVSAAVRQNRWHQSDDRGVACVSSVDPQTSPARKSIEQGFVPQPLAMHAARV
jgi:hypothetical protein